MNSYFKLVLLTAIFVATTFTVSCSGDDGATGPKGEQGDPGVPGSPGAPCTQSSDDNGTLKLTCGTTTSILLCGGNPFNSKTQICDARDGNAYKFVDIDGQIWLAENVKFKTAGSVCYDGLPSNCAKYGRLYTWAEAKVACPSGWSLPDTTEFAALIAFAGTGAAAKLKSEEVGGTDDFGFEALLGGYKLYSSTTFESESTAGRFWSLTELDPNVFFFQISSEARIIVRGKTDMYSVRCIKED